MKHEMLTFATALLVAAVAPAAGADTAVQVSGEVRHRFEADNRDLGTGDAYTYGLLRSRLNLAMTPSEEIEAFMQIQDSRTMGEETNTLTDGSADALDFHQAWIRVRRVLGLPVDAKVGRMEVAFGPERLIGSVGWSNVGRSFDGAMAHMAGEKASADAFFFTEREALAAGDEGDRRVFGVYGEVVPWTDQIVQPFLIWQLAVPSAELNRRTFGFYAKGKASELTHEVEFAFQNGEITAGENYDVQAWMGAVTLTYVVPGSSVKPKFVAGVDYLSGDDDAADDTIKAFDTLYATNHKYYGFMDYFTNLPVNTYGRGLVDAHGAVQITPVEKTDARLDLHLFRAAEDVPLPGDETSKDFGQEVDLTVTHRYAPPLALTLGASVFLPGKIFEEKRGDETGTWFYLMTTVRL